MHDHDDPLPDSGHPAFCVHYPGKCKKLQREHDQVQAFSDEWPVHDHDNPLPDSGHPAFCVQYPGYCKNLQRQHGQVQAFSDEWPVHDHDSLLPDSGHPAFVHNTQAILRTCNVKMVRSKLSQTNG